MGKLHSDISSARFRWILGALAVTLAFFLVWLVFWPWDVALPEDADLRPAPPPELPLEDNADTYLAEAASRLVLQAYGKYGEQLKLDSFDDYAHAKPWPFDEEFAEKIVKANADVFPLIEKGLACPGWNHPAILPPGRWSFDGLNNLQRLLRMKSRWESWSGNYTAAAATLFQSTRMNRMLIEKNPGNSTFWRGLQWWEQENFRHLAWDPKTPDTVLAAMEADLARLDIRMLTEGYRSALRDSYQELVSNIHDPEKAERLFGSHLSSDPLRLDKWPVVPAYCLKPGITLRRVAREQRSFIARAGVPYAEFLKGSAGFRSPQTPWRIRFMLLKPNGIGQRIYEAACLKDPDFSLSGIDYWKWTCLHLADIHALRLTIACKRYERKHGKLPETLDQLVPEFISAVLPDPLDGRPMCYSREKQRVWSVGMDGIDNGGNIGDLSHVYNGCGYDIVCPFSKPLPGEPGYKESALMFFFQDSLPSNIFLTDPAPVPEPAEEKPSTPSPQSTKDNALTP